MVEEVRQYPFLNGEAIQVSGLMTEPTVVGSYEISVDSPWIEAPQPSVLDLSRGKAFPLEWSTQEIPDPQGIHYPRYGSDPLLKATVNRGSLKLSAVDLAISRNALRKLFYCFMPRSNKFTHNFSLTVEQVSEKLTVIRKSPVEAEEGYGTPAGFGMDFENKMTVPVEGPFSSYYEAVSYKIGTYKVLVGCEVDAVDSDGHSVELKTSKIQDLSQQYFLDQDRAHKRDIWLQMKLSGTKNMYLGKIAFPEGQLTQGQSAPVTVEHLGVNEVRTLGQFNDVDEHHVFAKVEELLKWIKEQLPFAGGRKVAILKYTKEVDYQAAKPERPAKPARPATGRYPAQPAVPYRAAQPEIPHVDASLTLTIEDFSQDKSTISEPFFNANLRALLN
eukprot:gene9915-10966_t